MCGIIVLHKPHHMKTNVTITVGNHRFQCELAPNNKRRRIQMELAPEGAIKNPELWLTPKGTAAILASVLDTVELKSGGKWGIVAEGHPACMDYVEEELNMFDYDKLVEEIGEAREELQKKTKKQKATGKDKSIKATNS